MSDNERLKAVAKDMMMRYLEPVIKMCDLGLYDDVKSKIITLKDVSNMMAKFIHKDIDSRIQKATNIDNPSATDISVLKEAYKYISNLEVKVYGLYDCV